MCRIKLLLSSKAGKKTKSSALFSISFSFLFCFLFFFYKKVKIAVVFDVWFWWIERFDGGWNAFFPEVHHFWNWTALRRKLKIVNVQVSNGSNTYLSLRWRSTLFNAKQQIILWYEIKLKENSNFDQVFLLKWNLKRTVERKTPELTETWRRYLEWIIVKMNHVKIF